jgi:hypothetical protein
MRRVKIEGHLRELRELLDGICDAGLISSDLIIKKRRRRRRKKKKEKKRRRP